MRKLTLDETDKFLDDNGETDEGAIAIETTIKELIKLNAGTTCGRHKNKCFVGLSKFSDRIVKGWYLEKHKEMMGMIHIQCNQTEAKEIDDLAFKYNGSLRENGESLLDGFYEFENE